MPSHEYTKTQLIGLLEGAVNKTLGEVDTAHVFDKTKNNKKITGIAGDVIENSVLGYPSDSYQSPDLCVDGVDIELKTTGIKVAKKKSKSHLFEAKEPMSITAVSPEKITTEEFESSNFWHKLERMLLVYYFYDSDVTVTAAEYANFLIKGYDFHEFSKEDQETLKNDWKIVQQFIQNLQNGYGEEASSQYPRISSEIRSQLMMIDTAPKWPHRPRFRLKRATVTTMVQEYFGKKLENLSQSYSSFDALDQELHKFTKQYHGMTIRELIKELSISIKLNKQDDAPKSVTEQIVTHMFGAKSKKINSIEDFKKLGLIAKTITQTTKGARTEDVKISRIDFEEFKPENDLFEESLIYNYFNEQQFLCILFEEPNTSSKLLENRFLGFKRLSFPDEFINQDVKKTWQKIRYLVIHNKLVDVISYDKNGHPRKNKKTNTIVSAPNFPKSSEGSVFVRGSSSDSCHKPLTINGIRMYSQYIWIKGSTFLNMLNDTKFI